MKITQCIIGGLTAFGIFLLGCSGPTVLDQNWGRSALSMRYNQTLNPQAGQDLEPVEGLDGPSALNTLDVYRERNTVQKDASSYDIKVTGIGSKQ